MEKLINDYLCVLQRIATVKGGDDFVPTPIMLNSQRIEAHDALFNELFTYLKPADGQTREDCYWRSKELFSRLDKIFRLFNDFDLDLTNSEHIRFLTKDLDRFLLKTEVKYYLEGKTKGIHGVIEPWEDEDH